MNDRKDFQVALNADLIEAIKRTAKLQGIYVYRWVERALQEAIERQPTPPVLEEVIC